MEDANRMDLLGVSAWFALPPLLCSLSSVGLQVTISGGQGEPPVLETLHWVSELQGENLFSSPCR